MSTSGGGTLNALAYLVILAAVVGAAADALPDGIEPVLRRPRPVALGLWALVAVPSLVQFAYPPLLDVLSRQPGLITGGGQLWRLASSELVQDGGVFGTVFNLAVLLLVACVAVPLWGPGRAVGLFLAGAVAFNLLAVFAFPSAGAGNSGATFALATSVLGLLVLRSRSARVVVATVVAAAVGIALVVARDAHGLAFLGGLVLGLLVGAAGRVRTVPEDGKDATR